MQTDLHLQASQMGAGGYNACARRLSYELKSSQFSLYVPLLHSAIPRSRGQLLKTPTWGYSAPPSHPCQEAPKSSPVRTRTSPCLRPVRSASGYLGRCCCRSQLSRRQAVRVMSSLIRISLDAVCAALHNLRNRIVVRRERTLFARITTYEHHRLNATRYVP